MGADSAVHQPAAVSEGDVGALNRLEAWTCGSQWASSRRNAAEWESTVNDAASDDSEMLELVEALERREGDPKVMRANGEESLRSSKVLRRPGAQPD